MPGFLLAEQDKGVRLSEQSPSWLHLQLINKSPLMTSEHLEQLLASIDSRLARIEESLTKIPSPWLKGHAAAAEYAGFKSVRAFRQWAKDHGIKPDRGGIYFWSRRDIDAARERAKH
jgi:hypothetical protein